ncbi:histidinol dehydrogenase [Vallitalea okinawensis]|uniref:histidinol dehydrogenase n=1 Tax=Vallitalea okinawensis TaxID=2078660 RepID=UPI000CFB4F7D|nr:histidinol dehydrogenase [Vallitalea okinawensis]
MEIVNLQNTETFTYQKEETDYTNYEEQVKNIICEVKKNGDDALLEFTKKYDGIELLSESLQVTEEEFNRAYTLVSERVIQALKKAKERISSYHQKQKVYSWFDRDKASMMGQLITPIEKVGLYVPGGKAAYPSSVLMNALPAKIAGVEDITMVTPPNPDGSIHPLILVAAREAGIDKIFKVGGAQAIAALAYGTRTIKPVNKIVGPGNIYVALAKKQVFGDVGIDSVAGPSEILVIADETSEPRFVAADLLSQAEHDELAQSILVTTSMNLAKSVLDEIDLQMKRLSRADIIRKSLESNGVIYVVSDIKEAIAISNMIAPEHLELCLKHPMNYLPLIKNAGAIFLGEYSPEPLGDYMAGPNHVLPTNGTAKYFSPLGVGDFIKRSSLIAFAREDLMRLKDDILHIAEEEGLTAHANAVKVRF